MIMINKQNSYFSLILSVHLFIGCKTNGNNSVDSASLGETSAITLVETSVTERMKNDFKDKLRKAYSEKDVQTLSDLFYWEDVDPKKKKKQVIGVENGFGWKILDMEIKEVEPEFSEYVKKGVTYRSNLKVVARVNINFKNKSEDKDVQDTSSSFPLGQKNGKLFIVNFLSVDKSEKVLEEALFSINTVARDEKSEPAKFTGHCVTVLSNGDRKKLNLNKQMIARNVHDIEYCLVTFESPKGSLYFSIGKPGEKIFEKSVPNAKAGMSIEYKK